MCPASMERSLVLLSGDETSGPRGLYLKIILKASLGMWHFKGDVQVIEESGRKASEIVDQILMEHKNII